MMVTETFVFPTWSCSITLSLQDPNMLPDPRTFEEQLMDAMTTPVGTKDVWA